MPLPDASFDVVYCQQGMQHMSDPLAALREMGRLLKPGGRLGLALWTQSPFGLFRQVVADFGVSGEGPRPSTFGRDAAELASTLREAGFRDVQVQTRELAAVLESVPQALQVAEGTSAGAAMAALSDAQRQQVREAITRALAPFLRDGAVHLPSASNIASARK